ncbi:inactive anthranilate O-methyltransferase 1-like [Lolium rigidum]|uniref:inactive anthranilate O-methyltransferase 1-like n=1 Tax=Lolium rigidum TaxID=89674 RepID=UPI001F5CA78A|nr:inactive anthranilate O-methyltransferase 1-like [Lolium rigidum]
MASKQTVFMNQGEGETSYARNSSAQGGLQKRMKPLIEAAIKDICTLYPKKMVIADLGCSSGPNAIALVSFAVEAINNQCVQFEQPPPEVCVLLNDLPGNDFNAVVKGLVTLSESNKPGLVTVGIIPGSFYERLFTSGSVHLFCSSNCQNWLSEAPEDLTRNLVPAYDVDEHARHERLHMVSEAYARQFRKDFTLFLELRAKELVQGGRMVVSLVGKSSDDRTPQFLHLWEMFAKILCVMASEGVIDRAKFNSFYVPLYGPSDKELREIIQEEGSFSISDMRVHDRSSSLNNPNTTASWVANQLRAAFEPIVVQHFGEVMDEFVRTAERRWSVEGSLEEELARYPRAQLVVSLAKKT